MADPSTTYGQSNRSLTTADHRRRQLALALIQFVGAAVTVAVVAAIGAPDALSTPIALVTIAAAVSVPALLGAWSARRVAISLEGRS